MQTNYSDPGPKRAGEFAKKFRIKGLTVDLSPLSIRSLLAAPIGWSNLLQRVSRALRLSTKLRLAALGFKAVSRPIASARQGLRRLFGVILRNSVSFEMWAAFLLGQVIVPEILGAVIEGIREHLKPRDPIRPPEFLFANSGMDDFNEYALYHGWMKSYLEYLKWYCLVPRRNC